VIEVDQVGKMHQGEWVLRDVSLFVPEEHYLGLVGPGGAGKSLLLKIIAALVEPDEGRVLIDGIDIHALPETERDKLRMRIGMLFQNYALFDSMTVAENIAFPLRQEGGIGEAEIDERVGDLLDEIGLPHAADKLPKELSGGMKKRVSFARAIVRQPPLLLYDDPTAGLDPVTSSKIFRLLVRLKENFGTTAMTVSHDLEGIRQVSERVAMLDHGELIFEGTVDEIDNCTDERVHSFWHSYDAEVQTRADEGADER
jgi:phospholipid/cholesterol/gamma-HCH transport system ATP-binding protein